MKSKLINYVKPANFIPSHANFIHAEYIAFLDMSLFLLMTQSCFILNICCAPHIRLVRLNVWTLKCSSGKYLVSDQRTANMIFDFLMPC
jgi:hypothetical protein